MDDTPPTPPSLPARPRLSSTPSWVTLGFIIGALFVYLLPTRHPQPPAQPPRQETPKPRPPPPPERLTEVEAVFAAWGKYAVWDEDRTEIAMWNRDQNAFSDFYEVIRLGDDLYFRSIPALTRPTLANSTHPECPLLFTESERMHQEWLSHRSELVPAYPVPPAPSTAPTLPRR